MSPARTLAVVLALAACAPSARAMPAHPPKPEAAPQDGEIFLVTPASVGPATLTTPFDREALQRLFPDSEVRVETVGEGATETPLIVVHGPWDLWIAFGGKDGVLASATVRGAAVRGPGGERLGDNSGALGFSADQCEVDTPKRLVTCRRPGHHELGYVFDSRGIKGDRLVRFVWSAVAP